ncbi:hypothetical protein V6Z11_A05G395500 [Gossypium hirsutum]
MEKLKEKKAEYEAIALTDSSVNLENIDNRIITEVLGPESSNASEQVEQIAEVQRKYELQQELRADAAVREAVAVAREATAAAREAKAAAMAVEKSKKCDELQLQLQQMMQMFQ